MLPSFPECTAGVTVIPTRLSAPGLKLHMNLIRITSPPTGTSYKKNQLFFCCVLNTGKKNKFWLAWSHVTVSWSCEAHLHVCVCQRATRSSHDQQLPRHPTHTSISIFWFLILIWSGIRPTNSIRKRTFRYYIINNLDSFYHSCQL